MAGISGINGASAGLQAAQITSQYQVLALKKQLDATKLIGDSAIKLIQSASVDPAVGKKLNVTA
ncbi:MAG: putative motility protein [Candidatus Hydrogenedentes bacterium]|nr:putative motility protein [Candidatus Hydrogenedentota bacterium]